MNRLRTSHTYSWKNRILPQNISCFVMKERPIDSLKLKCKVCVFNSRIEYFSEFSLLQMIVLEKKHCLFSYVHQSLMKENQFIINSSFIGFSTFIHPIDLICGRKHEYIKWWWILRKNFIKTELCCSMSNHFLVVIIFYWRRWETSNFSASNEMFNWIKHKAQHSIFNQIFHWRPTYAN